MTTGEKVADLFGMTEAQMTFAAVWTLLIIGVGLWLMWLLADDTVNEEKQ